MAEREQRHGRRMRKSAKRQAFEKALEQGGYRDFTYLKAGLALVRDMGVVEGLAVVRIRPYGHGGLAGRDQAAMRMLYEHGIDCYVYSPDVGFTRISRERLGMSPLVSGAVGGRPNGGDR